MRARGSDVAEHTAHVATSFYVKAVPAEDVLTALSEAALRQDNLSGFVRDRFGENACKRNGGPMLKISGSGGMNRLGQVQERLDEMALRSDLTVGFINDRAGGILHAFADPQQLAGADSGLE